VIETLTSIDGWSIPLALGVTWGGIEEVVGLEATVARYEVEGTGSSSLSLLMTKIS
jgi:hypothetical protein